MAGAFGYEKEHYALSMQIGEQSLFPAVRQAETEICISAPGTSCRQQIKDGTGRQAYHPIESYMMPFCSILSYLIYINHENSIFASLH